MKCDIYLHNGEFSKKHDSLEDVIHDLKKRIDWIHSINIDDIVDLIDEFSKNILAKNTTFGTSLKHLADFSSKSNVIRELNLSLRGNYHVLDKFVELEHGGKKLYHAQPRGLAVHWVAGNVSELGLFSILQALLTKNVSLVKIPSNPDTLIQLLKVIGQVKTERLSGTDILKTISLVYIGKDDVPNQQIISEEADVRVVWGGLDAVSNIISLPKKSFCEDIVFGPKYSYAIIDEKALSEPDLPIKLAFDISMFDQNACSSPHTVFIETDNLATIDIFAKNLASAMDNVNKMIPKQPVSESKAMEIHELRTESEFSGTVYHSNDTTWTIVVSTDDGLAKPYFSRVVFVKPIKNALSLDVFNNKKIQTLGIRMDPQKRLPVIDKLTLKGGDRSPTIGDMSTYETPWDGMFVLDRMVRWISTYQ